MKNYLVAGLCLLVSTLVGCGSGTNELEVTGEVTINGKPLPEGSITFVAPSGDSQTGGGVIKDGKFIAIVAPGKKKVLIVGHEVAGEEPLYQGVPDSPTRKVLKPLTPIIYNSVTTTPLEADIQGKTDALKFELTGDAPKLTDTRSK